MKNVIFAIFAILFVFLVVSCSKDEIKESTVNGQNINNRSKNEIRKPEIRNDILYFSDIEHFKDYYTSMSDLYDADDQLFINSMIRGEEFVTVFNKKLNDSFTHPEDRYQPFLSDPVMQIIANENFEFGIGDNLISYINNDEILTSNIDDVSIRNQIRNMPKGQPIKLEDIPKGAFWGSDTNIESFAPPLCGCDIEIEKVTCTSYRVKGNCKNLVGQDGDGKLVIILKDKPRELGGFEIPIISVNTNGNFEHIFEINPSMDGLTIMASIDPDCIAGGTKFKNLLIDIDAQACDNNDRKSDDWTTNGDNHAIKHITSVYSSWCCHYESAEIEGYYFTGVKWDPRNADLTTTIFTIRKTLGCEVTNLEHETKSCTNCRYKRARVNDGINSANNVFHCTNDVRGSYIKKTSNLNMTANGSPEFECCQ